VVARAPASGDTAVNPVNLAALAGQPEVETVLKLGLPQHLRL